MIDPHAGRRFFTLRRLRSIPAGVIALAIMLSLGAVHVSAEAAGPRQLYVDPTAPEGGDGLSWATAMSRLQDALAAADRLPVTKILVSEGIQRPDQGGGMISGDRYASFAMRPGLWIRGGYAGRSGRDPYERDPVRFVSILCGDLLDNDDPGLPDSRLDNAYQVVTAIDAGSDLILDGFTVRRGHADGVALGAVPQSMNQGAGANVYDCDPLFIDCVFEDNHNDDHGAMNDHGNSTVIRCIFRNNTSGVLGAGLYSHHHAATCAIDCHFENNRTLGEGGGSYSRSMSAMWTGCTFVGNVAGTKGGGFYGAPMHGTKITDCVFIGNRAAEGGGLYTDEGMPDIRNCRFEGNIADGEGGGGAWSEGGTGNFIDCEFIGNEGLQGGGLYNRDSFVLILRGTFIGNNAMNGGGVWNQRGDPRLIDCVFTANTAHTGGGVYNDDTTSLIAGSIFTLNRAIDGDGGGGISNSFDSAPTIMDCVFIENVADNAVFGGGGGVANYVSSARLIRCVFVRNRSGMSGGAIYNELDAAGVQPMILLCRFEGNVSTDGGAIMNFFSAPDIIGCVIVGNRAEPSPLFAGAGRGGGILNHYLSRPRIIACTIAFNDAITGGGVHTVEAGLPHIENSIMQENHDQSGAADLTGLEAVVAWSIVGAGQDGVTVIREPAIFRRPAHPGPDGLFGTEDDDYGDLRLAEGSPGIDAGRRAALPRDTFDLDEDGDHLELLPHDLDGLPRFARVRSEGSGCGAGALPDLGAYEFKGIPDARALPEDLTGDGTVGAADLLELLNQWGPCPDVCCPADLDGSGHVDLADLLLLIRAFGR